MVILAEKVAESKNSLVNLAGQVLSYYRLKPGSISVVQSGSVKTVWRVIAGEKTYCLKRLGHSIDKAQFSVSAQDYIRQKGGNVPAIIHSSQGNRIVEHNGELFVLYEWIDGSDLNFRLASDLQAALQGLAKFHTASRGYAASAEARVSTKLGKWPEQYASMRNRLAAWKEEALPKNRITSHSAFLKHADRIMEMADNSLELLSRSQYAKLSANPAAAVLCHQDYGPGNALKTPSGVYVLDLDGVTYDFAARDLRKIIGKQAEMRGKWDASMISQVLDAYLRINPLSDSEKELLYIDLLFPHWFFGLIKNQYQNSKLLKSDEIERMSALEQSKVPVLKELLKKG